MFLQKWQVFWNVLKVSEMAEQQETFDFETILLFLNFYVTLVKKMPVQRNESFCLNECLCTFPQKHTADSLFHISQLHSLRRLLCK